MGPFFWGGGGWGSWRGKLGQERAGEAECRRLAAPPHLPSLCCPALPWQVPVLPFGIPDYDVGEERFDLRLPHVDKGKWWGLGGARVCVRVRGVGWGAWVGGWGGGENSPAQASASSAARLCAALRRVQHSAAVPLLLAGWEDEELANDPLGLKQLGRALGFGRKGGSGTGGSDKGGSSGKVSRK